MAQAGLPAVPVSSRVFDGLVVGAGVLVFAGALLGVLTDAWTAPWGYLFTVPLIALISHFPLILERAGGAIEIGFDSSVLIFLICMLPPAEVLVLWSLGALLSQVTTGKRAAVKRFNVGIGVVSGAVAVLIFAALAGDVPGTPRELLAVALAATAYFGTDFLVSAVAVGLEERSPVLGQILQPGALIAVAGFVPFDALGYLGALVVRLAPWWAVSLLAVPLITLLVATRAVTRGRENARRLEVLFDAAVRAQAMPEAQQVTDALVEDARTLLHVPHVEVRAEPPGPDEIGARLRDGGQKWVVAQAHNRARATIAADRQALEAMAAVSAEAYSRLRLTEEMTHLARHDALTGLPNRALLLDRVEHALRMSRRNGSRLALLFCDLDGFKRVNDRFGHAAGDEVLVDAAGRLAGCFRESDTVARLGGDEFAILLEGVHADEVDAACRRVLDALRRGAEVAGHTVPLSTSIGVAMCEAGHTAAHLLRNADMAMYQAKALGKDQFVHYEQDLGRARVQRLELVESLRAAVAARDLRLVYQPVVAAQTGRIVEVEALARWTLDDAVVPPDVFISAAEESGLIVALGELVLDMVAADAPRLRAAAGGAVRVAVNISAQQLRCPTFVSKVQSVCARMPGVTLTLEVTERDFVNDDPVTVQAMNELAGLGVRFAVDDFGVGFSSLGYLQQLPVNVLKADRSFSAKIDQDERSCGLLRSIVVMGQALGLEIVVEGIERPAQLVHLHEHAGAVLAQGYLLHRPMPVDDVVRVLRQSRQGSLEPSAATL